VRDTKARRPQGTIRFALRLVGSGVPPEKAAWHARVFEDQLGRALEVGKRQQMSEGDRQMMEDSRKLGEAGLLYGTPAAEEMIAERMRRLGEERHVVVGQLAASGDLKTMGEVSRQSVSLSEARRGAVSAEDRQARDWLARAKEEAAERGVSLSEIMNEKVLKGEVKL
jgi:hypothetical protein